ncbi:MAG: hypothetical protein WA996_22420 [Candidatus Promineifilaceae bacterium]
MPANYYAEVMGALSIKEKLDSLPRRLSRLLDNPAIRVRAWYEPIARQWLETQLRNLGEIRLIVDGTKIGFGHQMLIVCLAYRKRAFPIAWTWVKQAKGHSSAIKQLALLAYVRSLIPVGAAVRKLHPQARSKHLVEPGLSDNQGRLSGQYAGSLEVRRKRALVSGHKPARHSDGLAVLRPQNVDQKKRAISRNMALTWCSLSEIASGNQSPIIRH